jgi:hypothetical protein
MTKEYFNECMRAEWRGGYFDVIEKRTTTPET